MKPAVIVTNFGRTLVVGHSTIQPGPVSEKAIRKTIKALKAAGKSS